MRGNRRGDNLTIASLPGDEEVFPACDFRISAGFGNRRLEPGNLPGSGPFFYRSDPIIREGAGLRKFPIGGPKSVADYPYRKGRRATGERCIPSETGAPMPPAASMERPEATYQE